MARSRNIKPSFFDNEVLAEMKPHARLLFIGLWCLADRDGRLKDIPKRIKGQLFAYENVRVNHFLDELDKHGFIIRYCIDGHKYIQVLNFEEHQNPHHKEKSKNFPEFASVKPEADPSLAPSLPETDPADSLNLIPDSPLLIPEPLNPKPETTTGEVSEIFSHWQKTLDKPRAKLTKDRIAKISARLKDGYDAEQCKQAIDGCNASAYHMGQNDNNKVYDSIELIFRNGDKLEQFIGYTKKPKVTKGGKGAGRVTLTDEQRKQYEDRSNETVIEV